MWLTRTRTRKAPLVANATFRQAPDRRCEEAAALYGLSGVLPEQDQKLVRRATPQKVDAAFIAFRKALKE